MECNEQLDIPRIVSRDYIEKSFDFGALLKNHEKKHKNKPSQFVSVAGGVKKRLENSQKHRKSNRLTIFDSIRNLTKSDTLAPVSEIQQKAEHRRQQLEKWKEEKQKRKKEMEAQKKKPFIAGVPHIPLKFVPPPSVPKPMPSTSGRVTRSQAAKNDVKQKAEVKDSKVNQSFAPKNATFRPPQNLVKAPNLIPPKIKKNRKTYIIFEPVVHKQANLQKNMKPNAKETRTRIEKEILAEPRVTRSQQIEWKASKGNVVKSDQKQIKSPLQSSSSSEFDQVIQTPVLSNKTGRKSLIASNSPIIVKNKSLRKSVGATREFTPKKPVPKSESSSEERLLSPKNSDLSKTPERSFDNLKISPCVTISRGKDNARREMKKKLVEGLLDDDASDIDSIDHFKRQLESEIKRMTEMCETWDKISEQTQLPDAVQEHVLSAVGQARLLMSQKLAQFGTLVQRCAQRDGALVTPADLHGFWDMVFMQVENVDMRFKKLEELRSRGWVEDQPEEIKKKVVKPVVKKTVKLAGGPSRIREMIAAARKAKKDQEQQEAQPCPVSAPPADGVTKTFEAGFFSVKSPVRSPRLSTPHKSNLLKAVLSSEAKKASTAKNSASFAMLRASVLGRNVDWDGVAPLPQSPLTPVNLNATPGRSILKSVNLDMDKSGRKSIKVVLFNQSESNISSLRDREFSVDAKSPEHNVSFNEQHTDSGLSSMDVDNKENSRRKSKLIRQDATEERSPVLTRSRRKSMQNTPQIDSSDGHCKPKRSSRKKKGLQETEENYIEEKTSQTPKRYLRKRKSSVNGVVA